IVVERRLVFPMENLVRKEQRLTDKFIFFYILAVVLLWIKTYIAQLTQFDLGVEGTLQEFLLLLNPLGTAMLFLGIAFFFKGRRRYIGLIIIDLIMSILLYANVAFYREFRNFITLPTILQGSQNVGVIGNSIGAIMKPYDI